MNADIVHAVSNASFVVYFAVRIMWAWSPYI